MQNETPENILASAVGMLSPWCPDLTPARLRSALDFKPDEGGIEKLLTRKEAAQAMRVSLPTVDRCLRDGAIPKRHIRGAVRIPASAIANILSGKGAVT